MDIGSAYEGHEIDGLKKIKLNCEIYTLKIRKKS